MTMRAWTVDEKDTKSFAEKQLPKPEAVGRDLLVKVEAVSINPVDTKVRDGRGGQVLGWDASGVVVATGDDVEAYSVGDEVWYAGVISRSGTNAQLHLVDERIVGRKPKSLDHVQAAALPLTSLTAWEALYEQIGVTRGGTLLVIAGAGGVGSVAIQLAKRVSEMTVLATASRAETTAWVKELGADHVVNHREDLVTQVRALGIEHVDAILCCYDAVPHFDAMAELIAPQGTICGIVGTETPLPVGKLFRKKARLAWELMFTKALFETPDLASQREILDRVANLVDERILRTTLTEDGGALDAEKLAAAHERLGAATMIGKLAFRIPH